MIIDTANLSKENYPLAWLVGKWRGTGQFGGVFGLESSHFVTSASWSEEGVLTNVGVSERIERAADLLCDGVDVDASAADEEGATAANNMDASAADDNARRVSKPGLVYSSAMTLAHINEDGDFIENETPLITETGTWRVANQRPAGLTDESQFPLEIEITTSWLIARGDGTKSLEPVWTTKYVGLVGQGKIEILSDEITIHNSDLDFANNLWRSKRMFGYVNQRIMWVWDVAQIGSQEFGGGLQSIASAGMWADDTVSRVDGASGASKRDVITRVDSADTATDNKSMQDDKMNKKEGK